MHDQIQIITSFIKSTLKKTNKTKLVIGISGGIDSAVALTLATQAVGKEKVFPLLMPYGDQDISDSLDICRFNFIPTDNIQIFNIKEGVDNLWHEINKQCHSDQTDLPLETLVQKGSLVQNQIQKNDSEVGLQPAQNDTNKVRLGNIMARVRMIILFDQAKKLDALVCGTENKSEKYLGYFTRFGDGASDIEPIQHLYKTQVWQLAKELNIPQQFIGKAPTAGLWDGQTDEQELGFSYNQADQILEQLIDENKKPEEIKIDGIEKEIVLKVVKQVQSQKFKFEVPYHL